MQESERDRREAERSSRKEWEESEQKRREKEDERNAAKIRELEQKLSDSRRPGIDYEWILLMSRGWTPL